MKRTIETHEHHHHYNWDKFLWQFLILIVVIILIGRIANIIDRNETVYRQCTNTCSEKHFMGYQLGDDINIKQTTLQKQSTVKIYNPTIEEFDRTDCVKSCNEMYLEIRK